MEETYAGPTTTQTHKMVNACLVELHGQNQDQSSQTQVT
jgi:hypothetical protein